jgi:hypothetical protein
MEIISFGETVSIGVAEKPPRTVEVVTFSTVRRAVDTAFIRESFRDDTTLFYNVTIRYSLTR